MGLTMHNFEQCFNFQICRLEKQDHLFDKPLAEGRSDPLSGVNAAVDPHGFLLGTTSLS